MADTYESGVITSGSLPAGQRTYYEAKLLENLRLKSILVPFCKVKEDFQGRDTGKITYTEVLDTEPDWNPETESTVWMSGAHLDSRTISLDLEIHGDVLKVTDYSELVNYWNGGDLRGLVNGKLGQNMIDHLDICARNAFLAHPNPVFAGTATSLATLGASDIFTPDMAEKARIHLEENEIPGVASMDDSGIQTIACVTTPRVIYDIRNAAGTEWTEVQNYHSTGRRFSGEVGTWAGVRFIKTNRMKLRNAGAVIAQDTLVTATVPGQGAAATVDTVYSVGQNTSTRYITVVDVTGFAVGQYVTISSQSTHAGGTAPVFSDGTQEVRRIVAINTGPKQIILDKPLLKPHAAGDFITKGIDLHGSNFLGGPSVVYGIGERPHPFPLPVIDDLGMIRRFAWRGFLKFQQFRPEYTELLFSAGSND